MKLKPLGRTGLFVSELCLGTMTFGGDDAGIWGKIGRLQQDESERIIGAAVDAGINLIDTADVYAGGRSEEITGQAIRNLKLRRDVHLRPYAEFETDGATYRADAPPSS